jgi:hypothetical protein
MEGCQLKQTPTDSPVKACETVRWKERNATRLTNGIVELISLSGGGHLASFRFLAGKGVSSENVLWEAPWATRDPVCNWSGDLSQTYGPLEIGKFLAGYTGHALCLDYFGEPSDESAALGLSFHGEAAITQWSVIRSPNLENMQCRWSVRLPIRQLTFEREIRLTEGQSVAYVEETVSNERDSEHVCDWVQHVTFGAPFLREGESTLAASAQRGITWPSAYEGGSLLAANREFIWPLAPRETVSGFVDLRQPFSAKGYGFVAGMQLNTAREKEFVVAANWVSRLGVGYCFRRCDFPWMTVWEENHTRQNTPWKGTTVARGMEFGTTPLPLGEQALLPRSPVFNCPTGCIIPARGKKTAKYLIFLFAIPSHMHSIQDVATVGDAIILYDQHGDAALSIPASECEAFLAQSTGEEKID